MSRAHNIDNRPHVRVTLNGNEPVLELMNGPYKTADVTRAEVVGMIRRLSEWLETESGPVDLIPGSVTINPDLLDVIEMIAQFASSLRW